ncbi:MAG TPA: phage portal protein [Aeromicrobium sp.]|nr:phage portal protein [Aeromicrobium sp.]HKY58297.1 phage portal protein [Aeromicrobium sp.]
MTTAQEALERVNKLHARLVKRRPGVEKAFNYYEGKQPLAYASEQWKQFHRDRYKDFADNWCGVVAMAPVDRLRIDGFRLGDSTEKATAEEQQLWKDWNRNELGSQSQQGFLTSNVAKRSATLVWGTKDEEPVVTWEHPSQVIIDYAPDGRTRRAALKAWTDEDVEYATLYLPDGVWKWQRPTYVIQGVTESGLIVPTASALGSGGWKPREVRDETWPLENPFGAVPLVEWLNQPMLGGDPISSIAGTMAMQDAINLLWAYMFTAADHASMPARVVLGAEPPKVPILDDNGQIVGSRPAKLEDLAQGRLLFLPGKGDQAPKIGQWDPAKLDVFGAEITRAIGHIAAQTRTPGHYLLTNEKFANLNGEALTAAEVPLVTKTGSQQLHFSPAAKETSALMAQARGNDALAAQIREADASRFTQWKDSAMHSLPQIADAATKDRAVGLSLRTILERRYGMTEQEIDQEMGRIEAEQNDPTLERITRGLIDASGGAGAAGGIGG